MKGNKHWWSFLIASLMIVAPSIALADSASSTHYQVDQTFFGSGGQDASSANYSAKQTAGELASGNTASANFQAYAGFNTTDDPFLEFVVTSANTDIGVLDPSRPTTTQGQFYVRAWQAGGYTVQTESDSPANTSTGYNLTPMTAGGSSSLGTEQFGINLVANTSPTVGADPVQQPDSTFSVGQPATGYDTANHFKYNKGDIIALSTKSTSVTVFTVSYLFNISDTTPSGKYIFNHDMVATGTY